MSSAACLQATLDLTHEVSSVARPADAVVSAWFRARRFIGGQDRTLIVDQLYALLRHQARLDWWLGKHGRPATPRNRLLAWLALEGRTPDQVRGLFNGGRFAPAVLTDDERALVGKLQGCTIAHPAMPEEVRVECPPWAVAPLRRRFGEAFGHELAAMLAPPPLDLRVNPLKATRDDVLRALKNLGLPAEACGLAPYGIRVAEKPSLADVPMLERGEVEIQDEGSQLVALLVDAKPGERVVDFCAGAGGKTLALAAAMANKGHVVACDISEGRLKRAAERFRRAGLHNIETRLLTSESDRWVKRHKAGFDRVLVDAPCSGTGTWRRNPDARWRTEQRRLLPTCSTSKKDSEDKDKASRSETHSTSEAVAGAGLETLVPLQARILASAARLVKPGGRLVYATCSLLAEENEAQVEGFLAAHPGFRVVPLREAGVKVSGLVDAEYLSLTPARHGTDGFFAAVMQREAAPPT